MSERTPATYHLARGLFLRGLGLCHLVAFLSLSAQIQGLVGSRGISPVGDFLHAVRERFGGSAWWRVPTLCWLDESDAALAVQGTAGVLLSFLLIVGVAPIPVLIALWVTYLSLSLAGQVFLSFQWDTLLLEATLCAIFIAPRTFVASVRPARWRPPPGAGLFVVRLLLFKLILLSGATKLLSGDPTWRDATALLHHYETQPLPTWTSWYAHQLPAWWQAISVWSMFVIELGAPLFVFGPRMLRHVAGLAIIALQIGIAATGNYGFFNLLTIVLCVPLFDDRLLTRFLPRRVRERLSETSAAVRTAGSWRRTMRVASWTFVTPVIIASVISMASELVRTAERATQPNPKAVTRVLALLDSAIVRWGELWMLEPIAPFRSINGYGLFRVMTRERPELVMEGTLDGRTWVEYAFRWKPGALARPPGFVAPHMPRLDWQMWFAALNPQGSAWWLERLAHRLLDAEPDVLALLDADPFTGERPIAVRYVLYEYSFSTPAERAASGVWWTRDRQAEFGPFARRSAP